MIISNGKLHKLTIFSKLVVIFTQVFIRYRDQRYLHTADVGKNIFFTTKIRVMVISWHATCNNNNKMVR